MKLETESLLISVDRLAELLQVSPRTVWRLVSAGQVPKPLRIGGNTRWPLDSVKEWIEQGCPAQR